MNQPKMIMQMSGLQDLPSIAAALIKEAGAARVWCFEGPMGAGKTTLIAAICNHYGVNEQVSSPSFGLVNVYTSGTGEDIYHFDFYRIKSLQEAFEMGAEEMFFSGNYCFVEWPEQVSDLLPNQVFRIKIDIFEGSMRKINTQHAC